MAICALWEKQRAHVAFNWFGRELGTLDPEGLPPAKAYGAEPYKARIPTTLNRSTSGDNPPCGRATGEYT
ncbi:hypothetical protein JCM19992_32770 [Thermostilla marina]